MDTAINIANYFDAEIKTFPNKLEGDTLPYMDNKKLFDALGYNSFSNHEVALKQYLTTISN